jgi:hypothetical protein
MGVVAEMPPAPVAPSKPEAGAEDGEVPAVVRGVICAVVPGEADSVDVSEELSMLGTGGGGPGVSEGEFPVVVPVGTFAVVVSVGTFAVVVSGGTFAVVVTGGTFAVVVSGGRFSLVVPGDGSAVVSGGGGGGGLVVPGGGWAGPVGLSAGGVGAAPPPDP